MLQKIRDFCLEQKKWVIMGLIVVGMGGAFAAQGSAEEYVGNKRSMKFHYQGCRWEKRMYPTNKFYATRGELIEQGFRPCKICKP